MYLGSSEKIKEKIREYNNSSDGFIFSLRDLEMDLERADKGWYNITSLELQNSLREIVARKVGSRENISVPTAIKLNFANFLSPFNCYFYTHWVRIEKEKLCEVAQNSIVGRRSNRLFYGSEKGGIIYLDSFFPRLDRESIRKEKEESEKYGKKISEWILSTHQEITEEIKKAKIDSEELEGIQFIFPTYCQCEVATPNHFDHILYCLPKKEQLIAFKNEMLELIQTNKARIDGIKQNAITKIENLMKEKGVSEEKFASFLSGSRRKAWQEEIKNHCCNRKEIEEETKKFLEVVEVLDKLQKKSEEMRKKSEEEQKKWEEETNKSEERRKEWEKERKKREEEFWESERRYKEKEEELNKEREKQEEERKKKEESIKKEQEQKKKKREEEFEKEQEKIDLKAEELRTKIDERIKKEEENFPSKNDDYQQNSKPPYLSPLTDKTEDYPTKKPSPVVDKSKEELSSVIKQLKKEIKELKEHMDPTNSEQKLLLSQKEEELHKLEAQFNKINETKTQVLMNHSAKLFIGGGIIVITFCFLALLIRKRKD